MQNSCSICGEQMVALSEVYLSCCNRLICASHLKSNSQHGIFNCDLCKSKINMHECLISPKNTQSQIKSQLARLRKEVNNGVFMIELYRKVPSYIKFAYLNEALDEIREKRSQLKSELNRKIDLYFAELMRQIEDDFTKKIGQVFEKIDLAKSQLSLSDNFFTEWKKLKKISIELNRFNKIAKTDTKLEIEFDKNLNVDNFLQIKNLSKNKNFDHKFNDHNLYNFQSKIFLRSFNNNFTSIEIGLGRLFISDTNNTLKSYDILSKKLIFSVNLSNESVNDLIYDEFDDELLVNLKSELIVLDAFDAKVKHTLENRFSFESKHKLNMVDLEEKVDATEKGDIDFGLFEENLDMGCLNAARCLKVLRGGDLVGCGSFDSIRVWERDDLNSSTWIGYEPSVKCIEVNEDDSIIIGSGDGSIKIINLETRECSLILNGHSSLISCLKVLPNKKQLISASMDKSLKVWDLSSGSCLRTLSGHVGSVRCVDVLNEETIVSGSHDGSIKLWDLKSGECVRTLRRHKLPIKDVKVFNGLILSLDCESIFEWSIKI